MRRSNPSPPTLLGRVTAWSCLLVITLVVWLSADPAAHARLHEREKNCCSHEHTKHESQPDDDGCVIAKFVLGQIDFALPICDVATVSRGNENAPTATVSLLCAQTEHLRPPACGPPPVV